MRQFRNPVWKFETAHLLFELHVRELNQFNYVYDGDDPDGFIQKSIRDGSMVAFDVEATVHLLPYGEEPVLLATNHLGNNVYYADSMSDFWQDHRDPDPSNRNCSFYPNRAVCHYFPDMIRALISEARLSLPRRR